MKKSITRATVVALSTVVVAGCVTTGARSDRPLSTQQKIGRCVALVAGGAILGNLVGKDSEATAVGAAVGGAACGVWLAFNNAADKQRLAQAQQRALQTGLAQQESWSDDTGKAKSLNVRVGDEVNLQSGSGTALVCRSVNTTLAAGGSSAENSEQWCRTSDGSYRPRSELMA